MGDLKTCFVISPIGEIGSETRKRSDTVFKHIIKPAMEPDYTVVRADRITDPGITPNQMFKNIFDADMVIADLTDHNPNVFYELAIRHIINKPSVLLIEVGTPLPFDIASVRAIQYDTSDLDTALKARESLQQQVKSIEEGRIQMDNPISVAIDVDTMQKSKSITERTLATVIESQEMMRQEIAQLREAFTTSLEGVGQKPKMVGREFNAAPMKNLKPDMSEILIDKRSDEDKESGEAD